MEQIKKALSAVKAFFNSTKPFPFPVRAVYFPLSFILIELVIQIADSKAPFSFLCLLRSLLAGGAAGMLILLIVHLIPKKGVSRGIAMFVLYFAGLLAMIQVGSRYRFGIYFQIGYMAKMAGQAAGNFFGDIVSIVLHNLLALILLFLPAVLFTLLRKRILPQEQLRKKHARAVWRGHALFYCMIFILLFLFNLFFCLIGGDRQYYTYNYTASNAIPRFGFVNSIRLESEYAVFGTPKEKISISVEDLTTTQAVEETLAETDAATGGDPETETAAVAREYGNNVMDIDFDTLLANDGDEMYTLMDTYYSNQKPTKKNEYTGKFAGKNLIMLTGEAFCSLVIDEERTPALYRLANSSFVFDEFYVPDYDQSTTGGEFANMSGIIPTWIDGMPAFLASEYDYMPFGFGYVFNDLGYNVTAWHNNDYNYYYRDETHPNMGYDNYKGFGNGLELDSEPYFPASDLEMMEATIPDMIDEYLATGKPFHAYYMTVSGHGRYGWHNAMSEKNREVTDGLTGYETIDAYYACNMELEYAFEYILEELEKAGILEDTVISLVGDHYPYYMTEEEDMDYYAIAAGLDEDDLAMERYHTTWLLWSGDTEDEQINVDIPCSSIDVVPTLLNLFGVEYDSRLFTGRDVLAPDPPVGTVSSDMHLVLFILRDDWISAAGKYDAESGEFYPFDGVELENEEEYVEKVSQMASQRITFAKYLIEYDYFAHAMP